MVKLPLRLPPAARGDSKAAAGIEAGKEKGTITVASFERIMKKTLIPAAGGCA